MPDKSDHSGPFVAPELPLHSKPSQLKLYGIIALCVAAAIVVVGLALRFQTSSKTKTWTNDQVIQTVQTIKLARSKSGGDLMLPGDVEAFTSAPIYAQVSGNIQKWYFDIGAPVKTGNLLAQIDPRPYRAALDQAKGQLMRDAATLANARIDLARYQALGAQNAISGQMLATQQATVTSDAGIAETDKAAVETAQINLGYTSIIAPFDGIVTSRSVDVGNLVAVGIASATPLFTVTEQDKLRIYVHVPQNYSAMLRPGMTAIFTAPKYPGRVFTAQLVATADAVQNQSGTQLVQFQIDNKNGALEPGDYAEMHFKVPADSGSVRVPATALIFRDSGMMVATVDATGHVALKPITISTDLGNAVEVGSGLSPNDRVIDNPSDSLSAGDLVRTIAAPQTAPSAG